MIQGNLGIGNSGALSPPSRQDKPLTEQQTQLVDDTLSQYDPDKLSQEDALSIVNAFSEAGISPGKALEQAMGQHEFDAKTVGDLAGIKGNEAGPPPPPKQDSITSDMLDFLSEQLDKYGDKELTEENKESIMLAMQEEFSLQNNQHLLDEKA